MNIGLPAHPLRTTVDMFKTAGITEASLVCKPDGFTLRGTDQASSILAVVKLDNRFPRYITEEFNELILDISLLELGTILKAATKNDTLVIRYTIGKTTADYSIIHGQHTVIEGTIYLKNYDAVQYNVPNDYQKIIEVPHYALTRTLNIFTSTKTPCTVCVHEHSLTFSVYVDGEISHSHSISAKEFVDGKLLSVESGGKRADMTVQSHILRAIAKAPVSGFITVYHAEESGIRIDTSVDLLGSISMYIR
jgi:hypothetical protein